MNKEKFNQILRRGKELHDFMRIVQNSETEKLVNAVIVSCKHGVESDFVAIILEELNCRKDVSLDEIYEKIIDNKNQ
jgi:hypothetical protein